MMHDAHLIILQFHTSDFGAGWREKQPTTFFTVMCHREAFHGLEVQDITEFNSD
jgi:hypothetical protein